MPILHVGYWSLCVLECCCVKQGSDFIVYVEVLEVYSVKQRDKSSVAW